MPQARPLVLRLRSFHSRSPSLTNSAWLPCHSLVPAGRVTSFGFTLPSSGLPGLASVPTDWVDVAGFVLASFSELVHETVIRASASTTAPKPRSIVDRVPYRTG